MVVRLVECLYLEIKKMIVGQRTHVDFDVGSTWMAHSGEVRRWNGCSIPPRRALRRETALEIDDKAIE